MRYKVLFGLALLAVSNVYGITEVGSNGSSTPPGIGTIQNKDEVSPSEKKGFFTRMFEGITNFFSSSKKSEEQPSAPLPAENKESIGTTFSSTGGDVPPISDTAQKLDDSSSAIKEKSIADPGISSPQAETNSGTPAESDNLNNENTQKVVEIGGEIEQKEGIGSEFDVRTPLTESPEPEFLPTDNGEYLIPEPDQLADSTDLMPANQETGFPPADDMMPDSIIDEQEGEIIPESDVEVPATEKDILDEHSDLLPDSESIIPETEPELLPTDNGGLLTPEPGQLVDSTDPMSVNQELETGFPPANEMPASFGENMIDESNLISDSEMRSTTSDTTPLASVQPPEFPENSEEGQLPVDEMTVVPVNQEIGESEPGLSKEGNMLLDSYENTIPEIGDNIPESSGDLTGYEGM